MCSGNATDVLKFIVKYNQSKEEKLKALKAGSLYAWMNLKYIINSLDLVNLKNIKWDKFM